MSFHQLPSELLWAILSHLTEEKSEERESLLACSLTCKSLVSPAQARIFHDLSIHSESDGEIVLAKFESAPHLRTFVKHLCLREIDMRPWMQHSKVLQDIMGLLSPYVVSLHVHYGRRKAESARFDFPSLAQLKFLEEISLREENINKPKATSYGDTTLPTFLNYFPRLRAITIDGRWLPNEIVDNASTIAAPIFQLVRLDVEYCHDAVLLEWLMRAPLSLRHLRFLALAPPISINVARLTSMINASQSLQHLEIQLVRDPVDAASKADLQPLMTAVRCASNLHSFALLLYGGSLFQLPVVVQALLHLDSHARLQQLTIGLLQSRFHKDGNSWDELQDLLIGERFPALRSVGFRILLIYGEGVRVGIEFFIDALPRLAERNMLSVSHGR